MKNLIIYFISGGLFTTLIVFLEERGFRPLSGFMALIPVFTLISYIFIGHLGGGFAVSQHAKFVLWGTIVSWIPYMITIIYFAPKIGSNKAIAFGVLVFFVLAIAFIFVTSHYNIFK
ncbi:MAG: GlpM family protein [Candidatus Paceibacterota bacterium]